MAIRGVCPDMACQRVEIEKKRTRSERKACRVVAEELGVSPKTVLTWVYRGKVTSNEVKSSLVNKAGNETCATPDLTRLAESGKTFGTIYADPPWQYGNQGTRAATNNHYPTMTPEEIAALPVGELAAEKAHLHLWTTNAFLFECPKIFEAWGFEYKGVFVWVKPQMGIGNYWRVSHEFMVLGVKGGLTFLSHNHMSWIHEDRTKHSAKPESVRNIIERVSPGPYLELFGRNTYEGWTVWGNEIERNMFNKHLFDD